MATSVVRVGVAAIISDGQGRVVIGVRKSTSHGTGQWQFPGGHLEMGESFFACAERETLEETGLVVKAEKMIAATNDIFDPKSKHYITVFVKCRRVDETQEPVVTEPDKCESWSWKTWADVKEMLAREGGDQKIFLPIVNLVRDHPDIESLV